MNQKSTSVPSGFERWRRWPVKVRRKRKPLSSAASVRASSAAGLSLRFNLVDEAEVPATAPRPRGARSERHPPVPGSNHRPGLALLLAVLLPGSGQAYNGQPFKGTLLLLTTVLVLPWVYSLFDARAVARLIAADGPRIGRGGLAWSWSWAGLMGW